MTTDYPGMTSLAGRGVVVLGAGRGIGGEVCAAIAQSGGRVLCVDIDTAHAATTADVTGGTPMTADITKPDEVARVFERAEDVFGEDFYGIVDVVGVALPRPLAAHDDVSAQRQWDLVLGHAVLVTQTGLPALARRGRGSVVFVGSLAGWRTSPRIGHYGAAKAALHHLANYAAQEFGPSGVRVNTVVPGRIANSGSVAVGREALHRVEAAVPLGRLGQPSDVAATVLFLLSDLAGYVSGAQIPVDGGVSVVSGLPSALAENQPSWSAVAGGDG